jgi:hypothetical protein
MTIDIDEAKVARNESGLWLGWTLATVAGMLLGFLPLAFFVNELDLGLVRVIVPLLAGVLVGLLQWLVLRGFLTHSQDWIFTGAAGWSVGFGLGLLLIQFLDQSLLGALLGYILFGALVAVVQWPILRREIPNIWPWLLASSLGWGAGFFISQVVLVAIAQNILIDPVLASALVAAITGLVAGAVTGFALVWIVRRPEYPVEDLPIR